MTYPSARVVANSIGTEGIPIFSVQVTAHRFILAEINTHRMLSRSYRSSRAVPSKRLIEEVRDDPAMPLHWGANRPGMQADAELDDTGVKPGWTVSDRGYAKNLWRNAAVEAARAATLMAEAGLHKQVANRVLEPFLWVHGIITATEWDNFFGLRLHKSAQPEFRALADAMWYAMRDSKPRRLRKGEWHLPYVDYEEMQAAIAHEDAYGSDVFRTTIFQSVARCARSSYNSFDTGKPSTVEEDMATYAKLNIPGTDHYDPSQPIHASPAEHQACPDDTRWNPFAPKNDDPKDPPVGYGLTCYRLWSNPTQHGNLRGWRQYRKMLEGESVAPMPKEYRK